MVVILKDEFATRRDTGETSSHAFNYDVFLSFRGSDTRFGFTGNLYKALCDKGIRTFIDDEELKSGEEIAPALVKAIQGSKIAIIVLSKEYPFSSFCLDELSTITNCISKGMLVIPVFYKVVPSHVRHHIGSYGDAFVKHEERFPKNKLQKWKEALRQVANLSGYEFNEEYTYEYKFIERIVTSVSEKINHPASSSVVNYPVGLKSLVEEVMKVLDVGPDVAYMTGIHGMSGVGKTRLARAVYNNLIYQNFDGLCFLENMKEESNKHGLPHLQSILLQEILKDKTIKVTSCWHLGVSTIRSKLQGKKVLLVLDDVDKYEQLQAILGTPYWFGPGSRVIIITQNEELLNPNNAQIRYEMNKLNEKYTLQMHTWKESEKQKADQAVEMNRFSSRPMNFSSYTQHFPVSLYTQPFPVSTYTQHFPVNQFSPLVHSNSFLPFNTTSTFSQQLTVIQHPPSCSMAPCTFSSCPAHNTFF